ncbi:hypothetical protein GM658_27995 [Pseudoduganella eburnea]|uniref:Uncharacterized protein n=1 Tax=Massilia eburnea TaxID=1776165 RepID=A0A6L6QSM8_9BURK|nr:hypothetical protein [Massilia eburnea]MTW14463.1 hypothetical protein [Massilia eburnea]
MKWNAAGRRESFLRDEGSLISFYLKKKFDSNSLMGNSALSNVNTAVSLWLCGLAKEIEPIFPNTLAWLDYAIEKKDDRGASRYQLAYLYEAKAICKWLAHSQNDVDAWKGAVVQYSLKMEECGPTRGNPATDYVEQFLPACVFAGEYERGVADFERFCGAKKLELKKVWRPREFAYALCLHHLRGEFGKDELFEAGKKMLRSYVDSEWLYNGAYKEPAIWLKLVYGFGSPELTPMQTLLSLYDVMGEPMPDFI